jgi:hypothetical protein
LPTGVLILAGVDADGDLEAKIKPSDVTSAPLRPFSLAMFFLNDKCSENAFPRLLKRTFF